MKKSHNAISHLRNALYLTDGGLESTLIFQEGIDLPCFAAFDLLKNGEGIEVLKRYYENYLAVAERYRVGAILETATWRANRDWAAMLGYDAEALANANRKAVDLLLEIRQDHEDVGLPIIISGNLGPRGDGYRVEQRMTANQARAYHGQQIRTFAATDVDMIAAFTMNYPEEAIGVLLAARDEGLAAVISLTVETDGRLPSGQTLGEAIEAIDTVTDRYATYFMINCAHPSHFMKQLEAGDAWLQRIGGFRANASRLSHAELDESTELDAGNPDELGQDYLALRQLLPGATVLGGCCGTDHRHVEAIFRACA